MFKLKAITFLMGSIMLVFGGCGTKTHNASDQNQIATQENAQSAAQTNGTQQSESTNRQQSTQVTIPGSMELLVTLDQTVETNTNQTGDHIQGSLARAVVIDGRTALPSGSKVDMVITSLTKGGHLKTPPEIAFTVRTIITPDGSSYPVTTSSVYEKGRSHTTREVGMIGGGAAAGAVIGGLIGKGKGAIIGGAAGAAAGTGAAAATGQQNLIFAAGKSETFTLKQPLSVDLK
jgi:hypothetical protein